MPREERGANDKRPDESPFEPEFTDEGPGSYLQELGTRAYSVVWGAMTLLATSGLGLGADTIANSEWLAAARLIWHLLPVSALLLLAVTLWQLGTAYTRKPPGLVILSVLFAVSSLGAWGYFAGARGVFSDG